MNADAGINTQWPPVQVPHSQARMLRASRSGANYRLSIALPAESAAAASVPVIYVLDAISMFATVVEAQRRGERRPGKTGISSALIVGIDADESGSECRYRDFTPGPPAEALESHPPGRVFGGAEDFLHFITDDVFAMIARDFKIDAARQTLIGHSLSAMFVLWTLTQPHAAFKTHVALSPSLWWAEEALTARLDGLRDHDVRVFIGVGEREGGAAAPSGDTRERRDMLGRAERFAARLRAVPGPQVTFEIFPNEDHASVVSIGAIRGLRTASRP